MNWGSGLCLWLDHCTSLCLLNLAKYSSQTLCDSSKHIYYLYNQLNQSIHPNALQSRIHKLSNQNRIVLSRMSKVLEFVVICFHIVYFTYLLTASLFFFWIMSFRLTFSLYFSLLFWYAFEPANILADIELVNVAWPCRDYVFLSLPMIRLAELFLFIILSTFYFVSLKLKSLLPFEFLNFPSFDS